MKSQVSIVNISFTVKYVWVKNAENEEQIIIKWFKT